MEELLSDVRKLAREVCYTALPMFWILMAVGQVALFAIAMPTTPYEAYLLGAIPGPMLGLMIVAPALFITSPALLFILIAGCSMAIAGELYMFRTMVNPTLARLAEVTNTDKSILLHMTDIQGLLDGIECFAIAWTVVLLTSLAVLIMAIMTRNDRSRTGTVGYGGDIEASHQLSNVDVYGGSWEMFDAKARSLVRLEDRYDFVDLKKLYQKLEKPATLRQEVRQDPSSPTLQQNMDVKMEV